MKETNSRTVIYQIEGLDLFGHWYSQYVDIDTRATHFATKEAAQEELENLVTIQGRNRDELRIMAYEYLQTTRLVHVEHA